MRPEPAALAGALRQRTDDDPDRLAERLAALAQDDPGLAADVLGVIADALPLPTRDRLAAALKPAVLRAERATATHHPGISAADADLLGDLGEVLMDLEALNLGTEGKDAESAGAVAEAFLTGGEDVAVDGIALALRHWRAAGTKGS